MCVCIYAHIYMVTMKVKLNDCVSVCVCVCVYTHIFIWVEENLTGFHVFSILGVGCSFFFLWRLE